MNVGRYLRGEDRHVGSSRTTKKQDPLDAPIPCDIKIGHVNIRKGVPLRTLVNRMQVLYDMTQKNFEWIGLAENDFHSTTHLEQEAMRMAESILKYKNSK